MIRWVVIFLIVIAGCVASLPQDPTISADLAVEAARLALIERELPTPPPAPDSGECENCKGTGRVRSGDGIEEFDCPDCGGDGLKGEDAVLHPAAFIPCQECEQ